MEAITPFIFMRCEIEKYWGGGHLNFNNMSGVLNLRIKIPDETFSYNLI